MLNEAVLKSSTNVKGISWKFLSITSFTITGAIVRYLTSYSSNPLPIPELLFFQNCLAIPCFIYLLFTARKTLFAMDHTYQVTRTLLIGLGILFWYFGLKNMSLSDNVAIYLLGPMVCVAGGMLWLKEAMTLNKILAIACSVLGSMLVGWKKMNGFSVIDFAIFFPIMATIMFNVEKLVTRKMVHQKKQYPYLSTVYLMFLISVVTGVWSIKGWTPPHLEDLFLISLLASLSLFAGYCATKSMVYSEATYLIPISYVKLILASVLGFFLFGEFPQTVSHWMGIGLILSSIAILTAPLSLRRRIPAEAM